MIHYPQQKRIPGYIARYKLAEFLLEDMPEGDKTTDLIFDRDETAKAYLQAEESLIFCGTFIFKYFFNEKFEISIAAKEGEKAKKGAILATVKGSAKVLLTHERVLLNILQRLCGVATLTRKFVEIASPYNVKILDTRKTTPGMRLFEKYAVYIGGGTNHRMDLSSGILIKDNHIKAAGGIQKAVRKVRSKSFNMPIEVEVENLDELKDAITAGVDGVLLDNMKPKTVKEAVNFVRSKPKGESVFIEASGGITLETLPEYVKTGINAVSIGALTHSVKCSNIHLEFEI